MGSQKDSLRESIHTDTKMKTIIVLTGLLQIALAIDQPKPQCANFLKIKESKQKGSRRRFRRTPFNLGYDYGSGTQPDDQVTVPTTIPPTTQDSDETPDPVSTVASTQQPSSAAQQPTTTTEMTQKPTTTQELTTQKPSTQQPTTTTELMTTSQPATTVEPKTVSD